MKGATAEPWAKMIRPPNRPRTIKIGSSQNFFRSRRKSQNSARKAMALVLKIGGSWFGDWGQEVHVRSNKSRHPCQALGVASPCRAHAESRQGARPPERTRRP